MLGIVRAAVVYSAAGNNHNVAVVADEKVVVNCFVHAAFADDNRNMNCLARGIRLDKNIDSAAVFLGIDVNIRGCVSACKLTVGSEIIRALRNLAEIGDLAHQLVLNLT